jgi:hypothetical protein
MLHILGIDKDDPDHALRLMRDVNPSDHFWTVACNILIDIVNDRFFLGQAVHAVIAAGGDIEVTAHNEPGRITVALVAPSGLRQVVFDNRRGHQDGLRNDKARELAHSL